MAAALRGVYAEARMSAFASCGHAVALVMGSYVPILLQKSEIARR
jgi:hypothetical protein